MGRPAKRARGRPTKLEPKVRDRIVRLVRAGNYLETAAASAGVAKRTLHEWLRLGARQDQGIHRDFLHSVEKAQAEAESRDLQRIDRAAAKTWKAAAWRLERRNPKRWGPRIQLAVQEELESFLDHLGAVLEPAVYEQVLAAAAAFDGGPPAGAASGLEAVGDARAP